VQIFILLCYRLTGEIAKVQQQQTELIGYSKSIEKELAQWLASPKS
jgi:hypothetical protein